MSTHLITGGAGFIGVNLAERLLGRNFTILLVDDLSLGTEANLAWLRARDPRARFVKADVADPVSFQKSIRSLDLPPISDVWHLAANSDIAAGSGDLSVDLKRTFLTTTGVLTLLREIGPARVHFASSSAIYGDHGERELTEQTGPLEPISYYGAMKLASEAQIRAAVENFLPRANIYRFANIIGAPATHGVIHDFIRRLRTDPNALTVLGDGTQRKPYLHVDELVDAMLFIADSTQERFNVFNVGPGDDGITVADIADIVVDAASPGALVAFGTEKRGWVGDVPRFRLSVRKLAALGWSPRLSSHDAVRRAVAEITTSGA